MDVDWDTAASVQDGRLAALGWVARGMDRQPDLRGTVAAVVHQAQRAELGDAVGLLMVQGRRIAVGAASDADVKRADELQLECAQGPGVEAILTRRSFVTEDVRLDARWRFWGPQVARLGWLSVLSVGLSDGDTVGSLQLYSRQVRSFSQDDVAVAEAFAAHAGIALANAREKRPVADAARARRVLRAAQTIMVNQLQVDAEQAFTLLRRSAVQGNRRMVEVAADVVAGRELLGCPSPAYQHDAAS